MKVKNFIIKIIKFIKNFEDSQIRQGLVTYALKGSDINQYQLAEHLYNKPMTKEDLIEAYAWAYVADYQGYPDAAELMKKINIKLSPDSKAKALQRAKIYKQYCSRVRR